MKEEAGIIDSDGVKEVLGVVVLAITDELVVGGSCGG